MFMASSAARAQRGYRPPPNYVQLGKLDQAEGKRILAEFRDLGIAGDYFLEFQLHVFPRRGAERILPGRLWGARNASGTISRVVITVDGVEHRLLIQDGIEPAIWQWQAGTGGSPEKLGVAALFRPLAQTDLTPFDLGRLSFYWPDFVYEGIARVRGRPAYQFLLYPPAEFTAAYPALRGVRLYLDTQFKAPVQSEQIGEGNRILKSMTVLEVKKVDEQWIPKSLDFRDEGTRNKTRLSVTAAVLGQTFPKSIFAPAALADDVRAPGSDRLIKIDP